METEHTPEPWPAETEQVHEHIARHLRTMQLQIEALAHLLEHVQEIVANPAKAEYDKALATALAPARAEYDKAVARAEYDKAVAPAWAEYQRALAAARAEYDKALATALAPARAEYDKAVVATLWQASKEE